MKPILILSIPETDISAEMIENARHSWEKKVPEVRIFIIAGVPSPDLTLISDEDSNIRMHKLKAGELSDLTEWIKTIK